MITSFSLGLSAIRHLSNHSLQTSRAMERLSSGLRINRAAADAAGLTISEKITDPWDGAGDAECAGGDIDDPHWRRCTV